MRNGILVSFEGIDGCGKSTQARLFCAHLRREGRKVVLFREPGGTDAGHAIRRILLRSGFRLAPYTELLLYLASRAQLAAECVRPNLARGKVVVLDRYLDSTIAYQGWGRGLPLRLIRAVHRQILGDLVPDITFYIDEEPARLRGILSRKRKDRMERESLAFSRRVRQGYLALARRERRICVVRRSTIEATAAQILQRWQEFLNDR